MQDFVGYLDSLSNQAKYFFGRDLYNYSRVMPVHIAEMYQLEQDDPETWQALVDGDFVTQHSIVQFTCLFNDQSLEQQIKQLKKYGPGIVGVSQDEAAMNRLVTIAPYLATLAKSYM